LDGADSSEIFDWKEGDVRQRRYMFHLPVKEDERVIYEFVETGDSSNTEDIERTGNFYFFSD
jgi:hypothetical protein